ncbi:MAG: hypothetical protein RL328_31, partial [Acidobacteriota bacterium]
FFYRTLEREFNGRVAIAGTAILGTSAGWASLSFAAVTDMPMAATFNAAMLVALFGPQALGARSTGGRESRYGAQGYVAGVLLGLATLANGFVPIVLIAPVFLVARGKRMRMIAGCILVAAPWYVLCYLQNGASFWDEFFWKHHVSRFLSPALEHVQPFWYYIPVLLAGLFPWTPLVGLIGRRRSLDDERVRFLLMFLIYGMVFFSASTNKLPAYVLPLLPAMAVMLAVAVDKSRNAASWLVACALLLGLIPVIASILPEALKSGITHVQWTGWFGWPLLVTTGVASVVWWLAKEDAAQEWSDRRRWAAVTVALGAVFSVMYLKSAAFPAMDRLVSSRAFWVAHGSELSEACADHLKRDWVYGLNYYAARPFADCTENATRRIQETAGVLTIE